MARATKPISHGPLTGILDLRSVPDEIPLRALRWKQNLQVTEEHKLCRRAGWQKLFSDRYITPDATCGCPGNWDLHDQLLPLQQYKDANADGSCDSTIKIRANGREPITMLFESRSVSGRRKLIAGTQSRLYQLNERDGNWRILADGLGGDTQSGLPRRRFMAAQLKNTLIFTNDFDPPLYYDLGAPHTGCEMHAAHTIRSLSTISLTKARVAVEFNGVMLLMNVEEGGVRYGNRIRWSGLNQPVEFESPTADSIAGFKDLADGSQILNAKIFGRSLIIYTETAIWRMDPIGGEALFAFTRIYHSPKGHACLVYPNSLVDTGDAHWFMSHDGVYRLNLFVKTPERVEWAHRATGLMYSHNYWGVNTDCCDQPIGTFNPKTNEIWFSWPDKTTTGGLSCMNTMTLVLNTKHETADAVDAGWTAFTTFIPDNRPTLNEWLIDNCLCNRTQLLERTKEGLPQDICNDNCLQPFNPTSFYNDTEDFDGQMDSESLCALLDGIKLADICSECSEEFVFIGAHTTDWCLKQIGIGFGRERCSNVSTGTGTTNSYGYCSYEGDYEFDGYYSIMRGIFQLGEHYKDKLVKQVILQDHPVATVFPASVRLSVGAAHRPLDPNPSNPTQIVGDGTTCEVRMLDSGIKTLQCEDSKTSAEHVADNTRDTSLNRLWPTHIRGRFLHYEFVVMDENGNPPTGGEACFSDIVARAGLMQD